ncbi:MAG: glucose-6-phosphate dehydrogenase [bacterium]|nr:glucose-6-phosphate dehydrogenase [bacterium]MDT8366887.1 glucose-6-phosphate dehydrogenase [bacterium]
MDDKKPDTDTELSAVVEGHTTADPPSGGCLLQPPSDPCTLVIIGASGDLTSRKLIPALYHLFGKGGLPERFQVVGCSRTAMTDEEFRSSMEKSVMEDDTDQSLWNKFKDRLHYRAVQYDSADSYRELAVQLRKLDSTSGTDGNRIFYLALPMFLYGTTAQLLGESGLAAEHEGGNGWTRIVVEKPYGSDRASAAQLDKIVHQSFSESQVYRIDHYLAKETVQNILIFRFANAIFEPMWNRNYIEHIDIIASETLGVEKRAGYYEKSGVLRDMFQNHMLQLLALTAMEPPTSFESDAVHNEKVKVFQSLRPFPTRNLFENLVLGQYGPGTVDGKHVKGYRSEEGVNGKSNVPTYGMMQVYLDTWRWQGVPFFLTSGKRLGAKLTEIVIKFREVPVSMFRDVLGKYITANVLTMGIQPREHITISFQTKSPGAETCLRTVKMDFDFEEGYAGPKLKAYEKAILDCMHGDQMLFWRQDGIDLAWGFIEPVLKECEACKDPKHLLHIYKAGSWGPKASVQLKALMVKQCK